MPFDTNRNQQSQIIVSDGKAHWISGFEAFKLPVVAKRVPFGKTFATNLRLCVADPRLFLNSEISSALLEFATLAEALDIEYGRYRSNSKNFLDGVSGISPYYVMFVGDDHDNTDRYLCRLAALKAILSPQIKSVRGLSTALDALKKYSTDLHYQPTNPPSFRPIELAWTVLEPSPGGLDQAIKKVLGLKASASRALAWILYSANAASGLLQSRITTNPDLVARLDAALYDATDGKLPSSELTTEETYVLAPALQTSEDEPGVLLNSARHLADLQLAYSKQSGRLHLEGALLPDTDRSLSVEEARALVDALIKRSGGPTPKDSKRNLGRELNCCAALLSMLTCQSRRNCVSAILQFTEYNRTTDRFSIDTTRWRIMSPAIHLYGKVPQKRVDDFRATVPFISLPLPQVVADLLASLRSPNHDFAQILIEADLDIVSFRAELKKEICPRATEQRMEGTMPVLMSLRAGDIKVSQLVSGNDLGHSTAPLHYFAVESTRIEEAYADCVRSIGLDSGCDGTAGELIGAPRAGLKDESIQSAISALRIRTVAAMAEADLIHCLNAITIWSAVQYAAALVHRWTRHLSLIQRSHSLRLFNPVDVTRAAGIGITLDKLSKGAIEYRVGGLGCCALEQLEIMYLWQERVLEQLATHRHRDRLRPLEQSLNGTGPCFLWCNLTEGGVPTWEPLTQEKVSKEWPEWPQPLSLWRHWTSTNLHRFGAMPCDIAQQLGHSLDSAPFDQVDPDAPIEFAVRIGAAQDAMFQHLGFQVLGRLNAFRNSTPRALKIQMTEIIRADRQFEAENQRKKIESRRLNARMDPAVRARIANEIEIWVGRRVDEFEAGQGLRPKEIVLTAQLIESWQREFVLGQPIEYRRLVPALFLACLKAIKKKNSQWQVAMPSAFIPTESLLSPITPIHVQSYIWLQNVLSICLSAVERPPDKCRRSALLILLAGYGGFCDRQRLLAVALHAKEAIQHPWLADALIVGIPRGSSADYKEANVIQGVGKEIIQALAKIEAPDLYVALQEACENETLGTLLGDLIGDIDGQSDGNQPLLLDLILKTIAGGRALLQPALKSAFERGELRAVGLSTDRMLAIGSNSCVGQDSGKNDGLGLLTPPPLPTGRRSNPVARRQLQLLRKKLRGAETPNARRLASEAIGAGLPSVSPTQLSEVMCLWIKKALRDKYPSRKSLLTYLSTLAGWIDIYAALPSSNSLNDDLLSESLGTLIERFADYSSQHDNLIKALTHFLPVLAGVCDIENTLDVAGELSASGFMANGYGANNAEREFISSAFSNFYREATASKTSIDAKSWAAFAVATKFAHRAGLRVGEAAGIRGQTVRMYGRALVAQVRRRRGEPLKTLASARPVILRLDQLEYAWWTASITSLQSFKGASQGLLCVQHPTRHGTRHAISETYGYVARQVLPPVAARYHHSRHDIGRTALISCLPEPWSSTVRPLAIEGAPRRTGMERIPRRSALLADSRGLGHGSQHSLLTTYCNILPLIGANDKGLPRLSQRQLAAIKQQSHVAFRTQASRERKARLAGALSGISVVQTQIGQPQPIRPKLSAYPKNEYIRILLILVRLKAALPSKSIQYETDCSESLLGGIEGELEMLKRELKIDFARGNSGSRLPSHVQAKKALAEMGKWEKEGASTLQLRSFCHDLISSPRRQISLSNVQKPQPPTKLIAIAKDMSLEERKLTMLTYRISQALP